MLTTGLTVGFTSSAHRIQPKNPYATNTEPSVNLQPTLSLLSDSSLVALLLSRHRKTSSTVPETLTPVQVLSNYHSSSCPDVEPLFPTENWKSWKSQYTTVFQSRTFTCIHKPLEIVTRLQKAFDFRELPQGRKEGTYENQGPNSLWRWVDSSWEGLCAKGIHITLELFYMEILWRLCNILECLWKILGMQDEILALNESFVSDFRRVRVSFIRGLVLILS